MKKIIKFILYLFSPKKNNPVCILEDNHISFAVDVGTQVSRPLTQAEMLTIKEAAKYERLQIEESEKRCAALLSFYALEIIKVIKYGMDKDLTGVF